MTTPPHAAERLLDATGATAPFREALLGDLAEEFACRVAQEGEGAARRWYWWEALRAIPHLLRDAVRTVDVRLALNLAAGALTAYIVTLMLVGTAAALVRGVMAGLEVQGDLSPIVHHWLLGCAAALMMGYIAAWLDRDAPLLGTLALGLVWVCVCVLVFFVRGASLVSDLTIYTIVYSVAMVLGGVLRAVTSPVRAQDYAHSSRERPPDPRRSP